MENDSRQLNEDELSIYEKLLSKQKEDLDVELKKLTGLIRQIVSTETKIERQKMRLEEMPKGEPSEDRRS